MIDFTQMQAFSEDPLILTEGDGIRVRDVDGRWYIDGLSGTFCMSLGHGNARVVEAATKQLSRLALAAPTMATSDRSLELARELFALLPPQYTTLKWGSGGSEAVEAAIKMARQFHRQAGDPRKYKVLSHYRAYHGVTGHALRRVAGAQPEPVRAARARVRPSPHARPVPPALRRRSGGGRRNLRPPGRAGDRARGTRDDRSPDHRADPDDGGCGDPAGGLPSRRYGTCAIGTTSSSSSTRSSPGSAAPGISSRPSSSRPGPTSSSSARG